MKRFFVILISAIIMMGVFATVVHASELKGLDIEEVAKTSVEIATMPADIVEEGIVYIVKTRTEASIISIAIIFALFLVLVFASFFIMGLFIKFPTRFVKKR